MHKIVKITESMVIVGNTEDKTFIKVPLENAYEGITVDELVDLFQDGEEYYITKAVKSHSTQTESNGPKEPGSIDFKAIAKKGKDLLSSVKSKLASNQTNTETSESSSEASENASPIKFDSSWFSKQATNLFSGFIRDIKNINTWLGAGVFLGVLLVISFIISAILSKAIVDSVQPYISGFLDYIDMSAFSINPIFILGEILFAGFKMTTVEVFGYSITAVVEMPLVIMSLLSISLGIVAVKMFFKSRIKNLSINGLLGKVVSSVVVGIFVFALVSLLFKQNLTGVKLEINIVPMLIKGLFVSILLSITLVYGLNVLGKDQFKQLTSYILRHYYVLLVISFVIALLITLKDGFNFAIILLGNYMLWITFALFGGQVNNVISGVSNQNFLEAVIKGSSIWILIVGVLLAFILLIDLDDLKPVFPKLPNWNIALIFSGVFTVLVTLIAMLASLSFGFVGTGSFTIALSLISSFYMFVILFAIGFVRLEYLNQMPWVKQVKQVYHSITLQNSKGVK